MRELRFAWDPRKAATNLRKHGVSFEEAETVFLDEHGLLTDDGDTIPIINARRADKEEQAQYWERLRR